MQSYACGNQYSSWIKSSAGRYGGEKGCRNEVRPFFGCPCFVFFVLWFVGGPDPPQEYDHTEFIIKSVSFDVSSHYH